MKDFKRRLGLLAVALLSVAVLGGVPVAAHGNAHGQVGIDDSAATSNESNNGAMISDTAATKRQNANDRSAEYRAQGKALITLRRSEAHKPATSVEARQKVCENHQKTINNKLQAFNKHADTYLDRLNSAFTKLQAYHDNSKVAVANYDELVAAATAQQTAATNAVTALGSLGTTIDCSVNDPAASLATVKEGAASTRDSLKEYRTSLKALVVALMQANKTTTTTTDGEVN